MKGPSNRDVDVDLQRVARTFGVKGAAATTRAILDVVSSIRTAPPRDHLNSVMIMGRESV